MLDSGTFSVLDAARLYVRLVNNLDPEPFIARLAPKVHYASQWVIEELEDRARVATLLRAKLEAARTKGAISEAVLGVATRNDSGMPLAILLERDTKTPTATASFDVDDGVITKVSICILSVFKPALLNDPDNYVWPRPELAAQEPKSKGTAPRQRRPDPDAASIIATFGDVVRVHYAPPTDEAIAVCPSRNPCNVDVMLVPPHHPLLEECDFPGVAEARIAAARGEILLFVLSRPDWGKFAVATIDRPQVPWMAPAVDSIRWHVRHGTSPSRYFDFDAYCELRLFGVCGLLYEISPIAIRPRPEIPLDELERRYQALENEADALREIGFHYDLTTWRRFLADGASAARNLAAGGDLLKMRERGDDISLATLVLDAWHRVAEHAAEAKPYR